MRSATVAGTLVLSVSLVPVVTKPIRASTADFDGRKSYLEERFEDAFSSFRRSSEIGSWVSGYHLRTAEMAVNLNDFELARTAALQASAVGNFVGQESVKAARVLCLVRDLDNCLGVLESTRIRDPYAMSLSAEIRAIASTIVEVALREGIDDVGDRAQQLVDEIDRVKAELGR
jgi:hypothetical protein